jgi:hypothetical protein
MDSRLRSAVDANVGWYEDICALHGVGSMLADGLWSALDSPPPLHSDAVVVEPAVTAERVLKRLGERVRCGVKDSFARLDLSGAGMELLFAATWIYRAAAPVDERTAAFGWAAVRSARQLAEWTAQHDTGDVLLPPLLRRGHFCILAKLVDDRIVAGAVARLGTGVVDVSNVHAVAGYSVDWAELAGAIGARFPDRPLVGYEHGDALDAALAGGFVAVGDLRVWIS